MARTMTHDHEFTLRQAIEQAKLSNQSLLNILMVDAALSDTSEALRTNGYGDLTPYQWVFDTDRLECAAESIGGGFMVLIDANDQAKPIILLRNDRNADPRAQAAVNIGILLHELGHLADFQTRTHLVMGKPVDIVAAEVYAHHHACRSMAKQRLLVPLQMYLMYVLDDQASRPELGVMHDAARAVQSSAEYAAYRAVCGIDHGKRVG